MEVDYEWCKYCECSSLLWKFMDETLPALWSKKTVELNLIKSWFLNLDKVSRFDNFCAWESVMCDDYPGTMQELYDTLKFDRGKENHVASPKETDWTFLVFVIRYEFLKVELKSPERKNPLRDHALSMELLDKIEHELRADGEYKSPSPETAPRRVTRRDTGRDTPEDDREVDNTTWLMSLEGGQNVDLMLARLREFIE